MSVSKGGAADPPHALATRAVHGVAVPLPDQRPVAPPIYQTSTFAFDDADAYAAALAQPGSGFAYTRYENPTTAALEGTLADLEGGVGGLAFSSGMAAIATVLLTLVRPGAVVVAQPDVYGGTYSLLQSLEDRLGAKVIFTDLGDSNARAAAFGSAPAVVYAETIANPTMRVADLPAIAAAAHEAGAVLVVDNTVASPVLCRPLEHGADVVVHSASKYLGGHSDVICGVAVFADPATRLRVWHSMLDLGGSPDPFAAWLVLRGLRTLPLRMERHCVNAAVIAAFLEAHNAVQKVHWPGNGPTGGLADRVLNGYGGFLSFDINGGREAGRRFVEQVRLAAQAASLGGPETLVSHPASTTHRQLDTAALAAARISPGMVRVSVGLEDPADITDDFQQALHA